MAAEKKTISLPDGVALADFVPVAYYDRHMDCIRVLTHDRSVTEHRIDRLFTVYECNHRGAFDPEYVGFSIKGVRALFDEIGLPLGKVYRLADLTSTASSAISRGLRCPNFCGSSSKITSRPAISKSI